MHPSIFTPLYLLLAAAVFHATAKDVPTAAPTLAARDLLADALRARQLADADALASASSALSIFNNVATTAFSLPTGTACAVGLQSYTNAAGIVRCCAGSIIYNRCFQDTSGLVYTADPEAVIDGETTPPAAAGAASTTAAIPAAGATTDSLAPSSSSSSSSSFSFATSYRPTATGGTRGIGAVTSSTSLSRLSQTLTPTAKNDASGSTSSSRSDFVVERGALVGVLLISSVAVLAGSSLIM